VFTTRKKTGTKKIASTVALIMPPTTPVPMSFCEPAPAPLARARGVTPATDWERRIDVLMDAQMHTLDFAERKKDFDEVQTIWAEQVPMISIAAPSTAAAVHPDIGNVRPAMAGGYHVTWNIEELYFKK